jgi:AraC-like DNA-binding protein
MQEKILRLACGARQLAVECGFANADTLRRAFVRHVGVTPSEYRKSYERS